LKIGPGSADQSVDQRISGLMGKAGHHLGSSRSLNHFHNTRYVISKIEIAIDTGNIVRKKRIRTGRRVARV
jgi:hypothetical protein